MSGIAFGNRLERFFKIKEVGLSREANESLKNEEEIYQDYYLPLSRQNNVIKFYNLLYEWKEDTKLFSSISKICMHPAYQRIIGLGEEILPQIFYELQREPNYWFWALKAITGAEPIQPHQRGIINEMTRAWLSWAKENRYI